MRKLYLILLLSLIYTISYAQSESAFQVLQLPLTAYDASVANTIISGTSSCASNPAITPFAERCAILSHSIYLADTNYTFADINIPLNSIKSALNFSFLYFDYGTMDRTVSDGGLGYLQNGTFKADDKIFTLSYARRPVEDFSYGISLKYLSQSIDDVNYSGFCCHLSILYFFMEDFFAAAGINNLGGDISGYSLPTNLYLGLSGYINTVLSFAAQLDNYYNDDITNLKIAFEYAEPNNIIVLRLGYIIPLKEDTSSENEYITNLTCGVGLKFSFMHIDYAWLPKGDLGDTHIFSLAFNF